MTSSSERLQDHRWGAGRVDPDRFAALLTAGRTSFGSRVLATVEVALLVVLLVSACRDTSPVETTRFLVATAVAVARLVVQIVLALAGGSAC